MFTRLLDTNIVSYLHDRDPTADLYRPYLRGADLVVSFMPVAELMEGAIRARWGTGRMGQLRATLSGFALLFPDKDMCRIWGEVRAAHRLQPLAVDDAWIAATAL